MTLVVLFLLIGLPVHNAIAYTITLNGGGTSILRTEARAGLNAPASEGVNPTALSYSYTSTSTDGGNAAESTYALTQTDFDIALDHSRDAANDSHAQSDGSIYFNVDQDTVYAATGSYSVLDSEGRRAYFNVFLFDHTDGLALFRNIQESFSTSNQSFTLGGTVNAGSTNVGSLTGTLIAGHDYGLHYQIFIQSFPATSAGATALGNLSLSFAVVPEPSTALLLGLGLVGLGVRRRGWLRRSVSRSGVRILPMGYTRL